MIEMAAFVAIAGVWSGLRLARCGRCGFPFGLLESAVRMMTPGDGCSVCRTGEAVPPNRALPARFASTPELERRGEEIRRGLAAMVERQAQELREARAAMAVASRPTAG